jgi:hypothetical protein
MVGIDRTFEEIMNSETGQIYRDPEEIAAAFGRGEPIVAVSEQVARTMEAGKAALNPAQSASKVSEAQRLAAKAGTLKTGDF